MLREGAARRREDYELIKRIAQAQFGAVFKARLRRSGELRAVKILRKAKMSPAFLEAARAEGALLVALQHPHVLAVQAAFEDEQCLYLEGEFLTGGELFHVISKHEFFEERIAQLVMQMLLSVVAHLHAHGVAHRDIKPENLVLAKRGDLGTLKLIDFGSARRFAPGTRFRDFFGTAYYMAPEIFARDADEKVDLWACGVIAYILLCGAPPFNGTTDAEIYARVRAAPPAFDEAAWAFVSADAKAAVSALLARDAGARPSAAEALQMPWFTETSVCGPAPAAASAILPRVGCLCAISRLQRALKLALAHRQETEAAPCADGLTAAAERDAWSPIASHADIEQLFNEIDYNNDDRIDATVFARFLEAARADPATAALAEWLPARPSLTRADVLGLWDQLIAV